MSYLLRIIVLTCFLTACGGGGGSSDSGGDKSQPKKYYTVSTQSSSGGSISPQSTEVEQGKTTSLEITLDEGYRLDDIQGCDGTIDNLVYTTGVIASDCQVQVTFSQTFNISGIAQLGMVSGATVKLFELPSKELIAESVTSSQTGNYGAFSFTDVALVEQNYYLIEVSDGQSLDPNMDGIADLAEALTIKSTFSAIATGEQLAQNQIQISALTDLQALYVKSGEGSYLIESNNFLDTVTTLLVEDISGDGVVNALDVLLFEPLIHKNKLKVNYHAIVNSYSENIYENYGDDRKLYDAMSIVPPEVVVEGGVFQQSPFSLSASLINIPQGVSVQWQLDGVSIDLNDNLQVEEPGNKLIMAQLSYGDVAVTEVKKLVTSYYTNVLAEKSIVPAEGGIISFAAESLSEEYTGTKIIIPAGSLEQQQTISINRNSAEVIPSTNGTLSPVTTFHPSGLTFAEPVTIALPYYELSSINDINDIRIARTNEQGIVDYLTPTKLDNEQGLVYFTTDHFSSYVVINKNVEDILTDGIGDPLLKSAVKDIEQRFPQEYTDISNSEWLSYLSTEIANIDNKAVLTVYDAYLSAVTVERIQNEIARDEQPSTVLGGPYRGYSAAFEVMYGEKATPKGGVLSEWEFAKEMISSPGNTLVEHVEKKYFKHMSLSRAYYEFKSTQDSIVDARDKVADVYNDRFPFDLSELNVIDKLLGVYKDNLLSVGGKIVSDFSDIKVNWQIKNYFTLREQGYSARELIDALNSNSEIDIWSIDSGWFSGTSYMPSGEIPNNFWEMIEGLYVSSISGSTSKAQFKILLDAAIALENIEEPENSFYLAAYRVNEQDTVFFNDKFDRSTIEVTSSKGQSFTLYFTLQLEGDDEYLSHFEPEFSIAAADNNCYFCDDKLAGLSYQMVSAHTSISGFQQVIGVQFTYAGDAQEIDYEFDFSYQDSFSDMFNDDRKLRIKIAAENIAPIANIQAPKGVTFSSGQPIELIAQASDSDGAVDSYSWHIFTEYDIDYNDNSATLSFIAPDVSEIETLDVLLIVTDDKGKETSESISLTVSPAIHINVADGTGALSRAFTVADFGADVVSITWDWGDGSDPETSTSMTANHDYSQAGTYTVTLLITTSQGDVFQQTIEIVVASNDVLVTDMIFEDEGLKACVLDQALEYQKASEFLHLNCHYGNVHTLNDLVNFPNMKGIYMIGNYFSDLSVLASLTQLETLRIGSENITDISVISGLTQLKNLRLFSSKIASIDAIAELSNLTLLSLQTDFLDDLSALANLSKLEHLTFNAKGINELNILVGKNNLKTLSIHLEESTVDDIAFLEDFTQLTHLRLYGFANENFNSIQALENIKSLGTDNDDFTDFSPIGKLVNLESLYIESSSLSSLDGISNLSKLNRLDLRAKEIVDVTALANLSELTELWLDTEKVTDFSALSQLISLTDLRIFDTTVSDTSFLANLTNLSTLYIPLLSDTADLNDFSNLTALEGNLSLNFMNITDVSPLRKLTSISGLYLYSNQISDLSPLQGLAKLELLNLGNNQITDIYPLASLTALKELDVSGNEITDITPILSMSNLENLSIDTWRLYCSDIELINTRTKVNLITNQCLDKPYVASVSITYFPSTGEFPLPNEEYWLMVEGTALPSNIAVSPEDTNCGDAFNYSITQLQVKCRSTSGGEKIISFSSEGQIIESSDVFKLTILGDNTNDIDFISGVYIQDTQGGFNLSWNSAAGEITHYELYRSSQQGVLGSLIYSDRGKQYTDTSLVAGSTYYYTAKACNSNLSVCITGTQDYKLYEGDIASTKPNLISEISVSKTDYTQGEKIYFSGVFRNIGNDERPEARLTFYVSLDNVISEDDTEIVIGLYNFLLLPDEVKTAPGIGIHTPDEYYFGVCVEVLPNESDTTDNCSEAIKITVH